jgi:curved DNA-binding protein CbpA
MPDATTEEIKKAYYSCMKECHPDLSGDHPDVTNFCMFINEVYSVRACNQVLNLCTLRARCFLIGYCF